MKGLWVAFVTVGIVLSLAGVFAAGVRGGPDSMANSAPSTLHASAVTHGDLVVTSGETYVIQPPSGSDARPTYYQGGNITVDGGGVLIVEDTTLSFVQTPFNFQFTDAGTVDLYNSTVTTDVQILPDNDASAKLALTVTGQLSAWNSTFAFPGSFDVTGAGAVVTLNGSAVTRNPAVLQLVESALVQGDTAWAPTIAVSGTAHLNLFGSRISDLYQDNWSANGTPTSTVASIFNITVSGAGSELSAVDSSIGVNWVPLNPVSPWGSNKLLFTGGAVGYLANISTPAGYYPLVGFATSAIQPDAVSQAYLYRWAEFSVTGRAGAFVVQDARVSDFYAYNTNQANNVTANALNNLATTDPAIWGYVQYWDSQHGISAYGSSNAHGQAFVLVASNNLTASTLQDGYFLGDYHFEVSVPAVSVASHWFNWSVTPYPGGVSNGTAGYQDPDFAPDQSFADYYGAMSVTTTVILANGAATTNGVRIGQQLGIQVTLKDTGTATITQVGGTMYYNTTSTTPLNKVNVTGLDLTTSGQTETITFAWVINDSTTGLFYNSATGQYDKSKLNDFGLTLEFNYGQASLAGGVVPQVVPVTITPSQIRISAFTVGAPNTLNLNNQYVSTGTLQYNGSQRATLILYALPTSGAAPIALASDTVVQGNFDLVWFPPPIALSPGTYTLSAQASYNGVTAYYNVTGQFTVPSPPSSPTSFLTQKILWFPLWVWLAIAAAIVLGLVAFLLVARRQAAGKLVECGECGNLIPEDATVCPKCGAEFEHDLIRCSRCASTIPADSKFCPECAAQLLGKPGEGEADPERQGYADFTEKYRAEGKRELADNYSEGAFWDWWKRQPTYTSFSQWKLQQGTGTPRAGMAAPPPAAAAAAPTTPPARPPSRGGGGAAAAAAARAQPPAPAPAPLPLATGGPAAAAVGAPGAGLKACPNCGKEIPPEYLVCPFCGAVTQ